jgi:hypothetical protein
VRAHATPRACALGRAVGARRSGALTVSPGWASRPPPAAPRARCCPRTCAPKPVRPPPGRLRPHPENAPVGPQAPAMRTRARPRPTTGDTAAAASKRRAAPAQRPVRQRTRQQRSARQRRESARRRAGADAQVLQELAPAEPLGERLHLREVDGPAARRARAAAPAARHRADVCSNGLGPRKVTPQARTHTRTHVIDPPVHTEPVTVP